MRYGKVVVCMVMVGLFATAVCPMNRKVPRRRFSLPMEGFVGLHMGGDLAKHLIEAQYYLQKNSHVSYEIEEAHRKVMDFITTTYRETMEKIGLECSNDIDLQIIINQHIINELRERLRLFVDSDDKIFCKRFPNHARNLKQKIKNLREEAKKRYLDNIFKDARQLMHKNK